MHKVVDFVHYEGYNEHMEEIIRNLKEERDFLIQQKFYRRDKTKELDKNIDSNLIKVITGPRRAGKSTLVIQTLSKYEDFFYLNFDSQEVLNIPNKFQFIKSNAKKFKNGKIVFIDEVQNLEGFELLVNQLQRNGFNVFITGSNANLLSRELTTHLTGRFLKTEVLPFSYSEALQVNPNMTIRDYMRIGGFPEQLISNGEISGYIEALFESIILKDIVNRYSLRNTNDLLNLARYLATTPTQISNFTKLKNKLNIGSTNTVIDYYGYLQEAFLINPLKYFSFKSSEVIRSDFKSYLIDTGIATTNMVRFESNLGYLFENIVFLELLRKGYRPDENLFIVKNDKGEECDFFINSNKKILIQSSLSVLDNDTKNREFNGILNSVIGFDESYVVVEDNNENKLSTDKINVLGFAEWSKTI